MTSILDSIDGALHDWETSPDAMRWSPRLAEVKHRAVDGAAPERPAVTGTGLAEFGRAIGEAFRPLLDWAKRMFHDLSRLIFPDQHRRCVTCHPSRKPKPLAVDGHEYQRRLKARRRRRKR